LLGPGAGPTHPRQPEARLRRAPRLNEESAGGA
jgi:hypothetical protein